MIYSSDSGLDCVYVINEDTASIFGKEGEDLEFYGLNSLVVDDVGNMVVSDSLNHKLKVVSRHNEYLGLLKVKNCIELLSIVNSCMFVVRLMGVSPGPPCCLSMRRGGKSTFTTVGARPSSDTNFEERN